jgi:hypothetical protein
LWNLPQQAGNDPGERRGAGDRRIPQAPAGPCTASRAGGRHGSSRSRAVAGTPYAELDPGNSKWTDDQLLDFMLSHPILIQRPIVETPKVVRICRPAETVLELLDPPVASGK